VKISLSLAAVVAFFAMALLPRATWPLIDPDVWWHIRAGETVLQTGAVPTTDTWSFTAYGHPWVSQDWLSNVLLALGYRLGDWGMTLLSLGAAAVVSVAFVVLWRAVAIRQPEIGWFARVSWFSVALLLAGPVLGVRVQIVDLLFGALVLFVLWRYVVLRRRRWPMLLPVLTVLWVNLHAGWVLLFLFGGAVVVGEGADRLLGRRLDPGPLSWAQLGWLAVSLAVSGIALVVNPNGTAIYSYPGYTLGIGALADFVGEWQRASLTNLFGRLLLGFVLVGAVPTLLLAQRRIRAADALILVGVIAMSVIAIRFLLITGPIGAAVVAVYLPPELARTELGTRSSVLLARFARPARGANAVVCFVLVSVIAVAGLGIALVRAMPPTQHDEISSEFPVTAVDWLRNHDVGSRGFNTYEWGGYLGLKLPQESVFIDGRADVFGDQVIRDYVAVIGVDHPGTVLDRYAVDHVITGPDGALATWLNTSRDWIRQYADNNSAVWIRQTR
jgi:hypothetical protein